MKKITAADPESRSADLLADNVDRLRELFPQAFTEGKVDFQVLRELFGDVVEEREERYGLNWHGKARGRRLALTPSRGTLRPEKEESVDWDTTQNLIIEGDNLEVLKLLQKSYAGKVKLIYIDPPYNTGKDFVYPDDFRDSIENYLRQSGQVDDQGARISTNSETSGRYHTDWLRMMYPRLVLARQLLRQDGLLIVSIDEREYGNLRSICSEIFGEENQLGTVVWKNATDNNPTNIATEHEYLLFVAKSKSDIESVWKSEASVIKDRLVEVGDQFCSEFTGDELQERYTEWFRQHRFELGPLDRYKYIDEGGVFTGSQSVHNPGREGYRYKVLHPVTGKPCKEPLLGYRFPEETMTRLLEEGRVLFGNDEDKIVELKLYARDYMEKLSSVLHLDGRLGSYDIRTDFPEEPKVFNNPKPVQLLEQLFSYLLREDGDIMVDFFAGSGSSACATFALNSRDGHRRRFILVQFPEPLDPSEAKQKPGYDFLTSRGVKANIAELCKERVRRAAIRYSNAAGDDQDHAEIDAGFRGFRLDATNLTPWDPTPTDLQTQLGEHVDHIKPDRTEDDLLYEVLLKLGIDLSVPIETRTIAGFAVYNIGAGQLLACFGTPIRRADATPLARGITAWHDECRPEAADADASTATLLFRDAAFEDDVAKQNLVHALEQAGLTNVRSL